MQDSDNSAECHKEPVAWNLFVTLWSFQSVGGGTQESVCTAPSVALDSGPCTFPHSAPEERD